MSSERLVDRVEALLGGAATFILDGVTYTVSRQPLEQWLRVLVADEPDGIVPGLLDPNAQVELYDRLTDPDSPLEVEVVEAAGYYVLQTVAGRPWWEAVRAVHAAVANWNVLEGWATHECGVDLLSLTLPRFCNLVVRWAVLSRPDEDARETWLAAFERPPAGEEQAMELRPEWAEEEVAEDFQSVMDSWASISGSASPS